MEDNSCKYQLNKKLASLPLQPGLLNQKRYAKYLFFMSPPKEKELKYCKRNFSAIFEYFWNDLYRIFDSDDSLIEISNYYGMNKESKKRWFSWWNKNLNTWVTELPVWNMFFLLKKLGFDENLINNAIDKKIELPNLLCIDVCLVELLSNHYCQKRVLSLIFNNKNPETDFLEDFIEIHSLIYSFKGTPTFCKKPKSLYEIFLSLSHQLNLHQTLNRSDYSLKINKEYQLLNNKEIVISGYTYKIFVPRTLHELARLSSNKEFNNCIGINRTYEYKANSGYLICALYFEKRPSICVMLDPLLGTNEIKGQNNAWISYANRFIIDTSIRTLVSHNKDELSKKNKKLIIFVSSVVTLILSIFLLSNAL